MNGDDDTMRLARRTAALINLKRSRQKLEEFRRVVEFLREEGLMNTQIARSMSALSATIIEIPNKCPECGCEWDLAIGVGSNNVPRVGEERCRTCTVKEPRDEA